MVWVKCRVRNQDRVTFRFRILVRVRFSVSVRSQEAPGTEPTAVQLSPLRAELRAQGRMLVRISLWDTRPDNSLGHWSHRPQAFSWAAAAGPWK